MSIPHGSLSQRIVETTTAGILVIDPGGAITFANAAASRIVGYAHERLLTMTLFDLLDDAGRAQAAANLERRRQGETAQLECALVAEDGSHVWVLLNASPIHDEDGVYAGAVSVFSEITERKAVEEALAARENQLAEAQRVAHVGSWEWDVVADRIDWSEELYRIFGLAPDELDPSYEGVLAHVHGDDRDLMDAEVGTTLATGRPFDFEYRVVRSTGEVVWCKAAGELVYDDHGTPRVMRGTNLDITEAKRIERQLEQTARRHRLLQSMASAANEASSLRDVLQTAVEEICVHTGWQVGHVYLPDDGAPDVLVPSDIWHLDDAERFGTLRERTMGTSLRAGEGLVGRQLLAGSAPAHSSDVAGEGTHASAAAGSGIRGHVAFAVRLGREPVAVLEFFATEAMELDQVELDTLGEVGEQLGRVAERERAEVALAAARDAALESSRLKSQFLATMSHEIRTPMNGVIGLTGLLLGTDLDDRQRRYAEGIEGAGEALLGIINDILDFSKIEAGKLELEEVDFDLVDVVEESALLVADSARRKGLELIAYCYPDVPTDLRGDPSRLRQVLLNLVSNAVKFTEVGEVVVRARLIGATDHQVTVGFEVADTGIGIAEDEQQRLFEAFSQADASTTRRFGGSGLGLAISTQLVAAMGGELEVDSQPGRGSRFAFAVPLRRSASGAVVPSRSYQHLLAGRHVLIVDDNATNRLILHEQLAAWDMRPDTVEDAASALERLREAARDGQPYDLAILDMCMEEMDGVELARRISADADLASTRLVLLTSSSEVDPGQASRAGIHASLVKPVRLSRLYDALMRITAPAPAVAAPARRTSQRAPSRGRVLVVEDNATNQMVATGILEQLGYDTDVAANGIEALRCLDRTDYAVVLMDCQMPEMDGYTATAEIRKRPGAAGEVPIIAMTAGAVEGDRERCLAAGMDDYIAKPVDPRVVERALFRWGGTAALTASGEVVDPDRLAVLREMGPPDRSVLATMVELFATESSSTVEAIHEALAVGDDEGVRQAVHRLRGAASNLGATALADRCERIERIERLEPPDLIRRHVRALDVELERACRALRAAAGTEAG